MYANLSDNICKTIMSAFPISSILIATPGNKGPLIMMLNKNSIKDFSSSQMSTSVLYIGEQRGELEKRLCLKVTNTLFYFSL